MNQQVSQVRGQARNQQVSQVRGQEPAGQRSGTSRSEVRNQQVRGQEPAGQRSGHEPVDQLRHEPAGQRSGHEPAGQSSRVMNQQVRGQVRHMETV